MNRSLEIPGLNLEDLSSGENDSSLTETMALTKEEENAHRKLKTVDDDNNYKDRIRRHTEREKEIERERILDHYQNNHGRDDMESVNELIENLKDLTLFKRIYEESTNPSDSSTSLDDNKFQKSKLITESRFERHRTDAAENYELNSTETSRSSSQSRELMPQHNPRKSLIKATLGGKGGGTVQVKSETKPETSPETTEAVEPSLEVAGATAIIPEPPEFETPNPALPEVPAEQLRQEEMLIRQISNATQQARGLELLLQAKWEEVAGLTAQFDRLVRGEQQRVAQREATLQMAVRPLLMVQDHKQVVFSAPPSRVLAEAKPESQSVSQILPDPGSTPVLMPPGLPNPNSGKGQPGSDPKL